MTMGIERLIFDDPFVEETIQDGRLVYIFDKQKHARILLHNLIAMEDYNEESLTDVIIISKDGKQFQFHAPILAASSEKLEEILLQQVPAHATSRKPKIIKEKFPSEAVQCLWDYAYKSSVILTPSNISEVKELAEHYGLDNLKEECQMLEQKGFEQGREKEQVEFKDVAEYILDRLQDLRHQGKQCSKVFKFSDPMTRAYCHSAIISAASNQFFSAMAYGDGNNLELDNKTFQAMVPFLQYLYTAELMIEKETVLPLMDFSLNFNVPSVGHACCSWFKFNLTEDNALGVMNIAQAWKDMVKETNSKDAVNISNALEELYQYARSFVLRNFLRLKETTIFLAVSFEELIGLIVDDDLVVNSEEDVLYAVMKWVEFSPETRVEDFPNLLQSVRLELISFELLNTILEHDLIGTNGSCIQVVENAKRIFLPTCRRHRRPPDEPSV